MCMFNQNEKNKLINYFGVTHLFEEKQINMQI